MKNLLKFKLLFLCFFSPLLLAETYDDTLIAIVEYMYGEGFLSQGGPQQALTQFSGIELSGKKMLDIGSGLGGPDLTIAQYYDVTLIGIDPDPRFIQKAQMRTACAPSLKGHVEFQLTTDPFSLEQFSTSSFDIVSSKESLLHIPFEQKLPFFCEIARVLKPEGKIVIVDWVRKNPYSQATLDMMAMDREVGIDYHLNSQEEYAAILKQSGFKEIRFENETPSYIAITKHDLNELENSAPTFITHFGQENYDYSIASWNCQRRAFEHEEIQVVKIIAVK